MPSQEAKIIIRAVDEASRAFGTIANAAGGLNRALSQVAAAGDAGGKKADVLAKQYEHLNAAYRSGGINAERAAAGMRGIEQQANRLTISLAKSGEAHSAVARSAAGTADSARAVRDQIAQLNRATDQQKVQGLATQMANVDKAMQAGQLTSQQASKAFGEIANQANRMMGQLAKGGQAGGETAKSLQEVARSATDAKRALDGTSGALGRAGSQAQSASVNFMDLAAKYYLVRNALRTGAEIGQAFYDFGLLGAQAVQVARSFETMTRSVGATPALLAELRAAARGTITDLDLMRTAQTALIGLTGQFGNEMSQALPRLLAIARAANIANPALGDTAFLFQSLVIGLKRLSPRLIDNTGLQLRMGEAYRRLAEQLGKSTEELSSEEQQLALLNATLEAGDRLIDQLGGSTESATDVFMQFKTAAQNVWNELAEGFLPVAREVIRSLTVMLFYKSELNRAYADHRTQVEANTGRYEDYVREMLRSAEAAKQILPGQREMLLQLALTNRSFGEVQGWMARNHAAMLADLGIIDRHTFALRNNAAAYEARRESLVAAQRQPRSGLDADALAALQQAAEQQIATATTDRLVAAQTRLAESAATAREKYEGLNAKIADYQRRIAATVLTAQQVADLQNEQALATFNLERAQRDLTEATERLDTLDRVTRAREAIRVRRDETLATLDLSDAERRLLDAQRALADFRRPVDERDRISLQNRLNLAVFESEQAVRDLAAAEIALADNTDPDAHDNLERAVLRARVAIDRTREDAERLRTEYEALNRAADPRRQRELEEGVTRARVAVEQAREQVAELAKQYKELNSHTNPERQYELQKAFLEQRVAVDQARQALENVNKTLYEADPAVAGYLEQIASIREEQQKLREETDKTTEAFDREVKQILFAMLKSQLFADNAKATEAEIRRETDALLMLASSWGMLNQAAVNATSDIEQAIRQFETGRLTPLGLQDFMEALLEMVVRIDLPAMMRAGQRAYGGDMTAGRPYLVGEPVGGRPNPELVVPRQDSTVIPLRQLRPPAGDEATLALLREIARGIGRLESGLARDIGRAMRDARALTA